MDQVQGTKGGANPWSAAGGFANVATVRSVPGLLPWFDGLLALMSVPWLRLIEIVKDPTSQALVQFGAGASPLRVALRTGLRS